MMFPRAGVPLALLTAALVSACESSAAGVDEAPPTLQLAADSVVTATRPTTWTARVVDAKGAGVAGSVVEFSYGEAPLVDSVTTDAEGYARKEVTFNFHGGDFLVRAGIVAPVRGDSASARVRVGAAVRLTAGGSTPDLDSMQINAPDCNTSGRSSMFLAVTTMTASLISPQLAFSVVDTTIAVIGSVPGLGGSTGARSRMVWGRSPGTTQVIVATDAGGADTLRVRVTHASSPPVLLHRMRWSVPGPGGGTNDPVVIARGDTARVVISTDPGSCNAALLPAPFPLTLQSVHPAIAQVEASEQRLWSPTQTASFYLAAGTVVRLRGLAAGSTELVATAPFVAPRRITVIVQ